MLHPCIAILSDNKKKMNTFLKLKGSIYLCKGEHNPGIILAIRQIKLQCLS